MRRSPKQARSQERVDRILEVAADLFVAKGYSATSTSAIATHAKVSIGSLYQFFPDKAAILQALARRYGELLRQRLAAPGRKQLAQRSLVAYVDWLVDTTDQFFADYPAYHTTFIDAQGMVLEIEAIEERTDSLLIQDVADTLKCRKPVLESADCEVVAFVIVKAIGNLLWLAPSQEKLFRQRLVAEAKRIALSYLNSYFLSNAVEDE